MSHAVRLLAKKMITSDVCELRFQKPEGFKFVPGQFVQFAVPQQEKPLMRSYSVSSSPDSPYLEFCIKLIPDGRASGYFSALEPGNSVQISDPKGVFNSGVAHLNYFIATGVGLAPIISMLENLEKGNKAELLLGARLEEDLFWQDRLAELARANPDFKYKITLSKPGENWKGLRGRVTEHLPIDPDAHYFICGRVEMVKDVRAKLMEGGVDKKSVHFEIF